MPQSQTVWSDHLGQEGADSEACGPGKSQHFWSDHGVVPLTDALENLDPNQVVRELWPSQGGLQLQDGESVDLQAGWGHRWVLQQPLGFQDLSGSMDLTSCLADRVLSESGGRQGLGVSASQGNFEVESGALVVA